MAEVHHLLRSVIKLFKLGRLDKLTAGEDTKSHCVFSNDLGNGKWQELGPISVS